MLVAYNENKQAIILFELLLEQHLQQVKAQHFYCPQCHEQVIIKAGPVKIPHFAHQRQTACDQHFSERESVTHLKGKQQLFNWLKSKKVPVRLEAIIPELKQRPDLLACIQNKQYALEFQCSPINEQLFEARTDGFKAHGIKPIWILNNPSEKFAKRTASVQALKLTHFQQLFMQRDGRLPYVVCYDVERQQFVYYHHLFFVRQNHYVAAISTLPLFAQHLPLLQPSIISKQTFQQLFGLFRNRQQAYINASYAYGQAKVRDLLWRGLYELRILYKQVPFTVGIPIVGSEFVCESTLKWQVALHYYAKTYQLPIAAMNEVTATQFLHWASFATTEEAVTAVMRYVRICQQLQIETVHSVVSARELIDCIYTQFVAISVKN